WQMPEMRAPLTKASAAPCRSSRCSCPARPPRSSTSGPGTGWNPVPRPQGIKPSSGSSFAPASPQLTVPRLSGAPCPNARGSRAPPGQAVVGGDQDALVAHQVEVQAAGLPGFPPEIDAVQSRVGVVDVVPLGVEQQQVGRP